MFDTTEWKAAVIADRGLSRSSTVRKRWAGIADLADTEGRITASLITIAEQFGHSPRTGSNTNAVNRLEAAGRMVRVRRGRGGCDGSPSSYQLVPVRTLTASEYNTAPTITTYKYPTDRAGLLRLAREVGEALLLAA